MAINDNGLGAPPHNLAPAAWEVLLIEDDDNARRQIKEYFAGRIIDGRGITFHEIGNWNDAFGLIRDRKADLAILDIYRGEAAAGGERVGERVLEDIKRFGFVPVIIYTNLPEGLDGLQNEFVHLAPKLDGLDRLREHMEAIFNTRMPRMHRAIVNHLDRALRDYMWGFVAARWTELHEFGGRPELLRLLLQRLGSSFVREGLASAMAEVFPGQEGLINPERAHPAEFYLKPPIPPDPALGDIRLRENNGAQQYLVVLWPTCDMVSTGGRVPKTEDILCARAQPLGGSPEAQAYAVEQSKSRYKQLVALMTNNRGTSPDRYHFLPRFLDIPSLIIDFQALEHLRLADVRAYPSLGVLVSPFAEHLSARFYRYRGRIGTPDLDCDSLVALEGWAMPPP